MERGSYMSNFGWKGQRSTFRRLSGCTYFLTGYLNTSSYFIHSFRMTKEGCPESIRTNCHWSRSVKVAVGKRLMTLPILVYCASWGSLRMHFVINFWCFCCFGIFPLDRACFFTFIIPGSRDTVQVVQTVQSDIQKFRFTELGSIFGINVLKNIAHNFCRCKKKL